MLCLDVDIGAWHWTFGPFQVRITQIWVFGWSWHWASVFGLDIKEEAERQKRETSKVEVLAWRLGDIRERTSSLVSSRSSSNQAFGRNPSDAGAGAGTSHPRSPSLHRSARTAPPASAAPSHPHSFPPPFVTQSCPSHLCLHLHVQESNGHQQPAHVSPRSGDLRPAQVCATGPRPPFPELGFDLCLLCLYFL
jgi:hypothetical protein